MAQRIRCRAELNYQDEITADEITVIFNGTTYTVPKDSNGQYGLEALMDDYTSAGDYPFYIVRESGTNYVYVNSDVYNNHNPFTIKIVGESVTTTECFKKAVRSIVGETDPLIIAYDPSTPQLLYYDLATQDYETLTYQMLQDTLWSRPLTIVDGLLSGVPIPGDSIYFNFYSTDHYGNLTARNVSMDSNSTVTEWYAVDFTGTPQ